MRKCLFALALCAGLDAFAGWTEQADDITLLAFRLVGSYYGIIAETGDQQERFGRAETV